ncbi:hypothetical protein CBM2585_A130310 [Cupriavidus taiwanensis]|nr:hypothetical protein CBM2585_A130310 [Cupriavidus taiwanensis]
MAGASGFISRKHDIPEPRQRLFLTANCLADSPMTAGNRIRMCSNNGCRRGPPDRSFPDLVVRPARYGDWDTRACQLRASRISVATSAAGPCRGTPTGDVCAIDTETEPSLQPAARMSRPRRCRLCPLP